MFWKFSFTQIKGSGFGCVLFFLKESSVNFFHIGKNTQRRVYLSNTVTSINKSSAKIALECAVGLSVRGGRCKGSLKLKPIRICLPPLAAQDRKSRKYQALQAFVFPIEIISLCKQQVAGLSQNWHQCYSGAGSSSSRESEAGLRGMVSLGFCFTPLAFLQGSCH